MAGTLDEDLSALKEWLRDAWRRLADPSLSTFERRELRNYIKEAHGRLRAGHKQMADRERARRETAKVVPAVARRLDFRIIRLDA